MFQKLKHRASRLGTNHHVDIVQKLLPQPSETIVQTSNLRPILSADKTEQTQIIDIDQCDTKQEDQTPVSLKSKLNNQLNFLDFCIGIKLN